MADYFITLLRNNATIIIAGLPKSGMLGRVECLQVHMNDEWTRAEEASLALEPRNQWVLRAAHAPTIIWESGIAWDYGTRRVVWHGGHVGRLFPQSNYTFLFDPEQERFLESQSPVRPQRRCLIHVSYLDGCARVVTTDGGSSHGSIASGALDSRGSDIVRADPRGPWLYDAARDLWEDCRTLPPAWPRGAYGSIAYEPGTEALFALRDGNLVMFSPRRNRVVLRPLPEELRKRLGYGLAADPVRRQLILFGGSAGGGSSWTSPSEDDAVQEERRQAYEATVKSDTWIYDIVGDRWREARCADGLHPPRGMPLSGMRSLQMVWHDASGSALLAQDAVDDPAVPHANWPPAQLWSFDPVRESWTVVQVAPDRDGRRPAFMGLLAYDRAGDRLWLFGGGRDSAEGERDPYMPAGRSRLVWSCRVSMPGQAPGLEAPPCGVRAVTDRRGVRVEWAGQADTCYEIFRAVADPFPGLFDRIDSEPVRGGAFEDHAVEPGRLYAYRVAVAGSPGLSLPAFNQPARVSGVRVSVESACEARLAWRTAPEPDVVGYKVYRCEGAPASGTAGELLTPKPLAKARFRDRSVDLSDGAIRTYWITTVNRAGIESGASPLAYSAPDAPSHLTVPEGVGRSNWDGMRLDYVASWQWPRDVRVAGFNVYGAREIPNGYRTIAFDDVWQKLNDAPVVGCEFFYPLGEHDRGHRYFFVRAVNVLGQEGFHTDIVSPTDRRFRP